MQSTWKLSLQRPKPIKFVLHSQLPFLYFGLNWPTGQTEPFCVWWQRHQITMKGEKSSQRRNSFHWIQSKAIEAKNVPEILRIHQQQVFTKKVLRLSFWDSRDVQRLRNACSKTLANSQFHFSEVFWSAEIQTWDCRVRSINATSVLCCTPKILEIKPAEVT